MALDKLGSVKEGPGAELDLYSDFFPGATRIEKGQISSIKESSQTGRVKYSYDVVTQAGNTLHDVQAASPYFLSFDGTGVYSVPEVGAMCVLAWVDGNEPIIIGYIGVSDDDGGFRNSRSVISPGSTKIDSFGGAAVTVESGGVVKVEASPACNRIYSGTNDTVADKAPNYRLDNSGGFLQWVYDRENKKVTYVRRVYQSGTWSASKFAETRMGTENLMVIRTGETDSSGNETIKANIEIDADANINIESGADDEANKSAISLSADGSLEVKAKNVSLTIDAGGNVQLTGANTVQVEASALDVDANVATFTGTVNIDKNLLVNGIINAKNGFAKSWEPDKV